MRDPAHGRSTARLAAFAAAAVSLGVIAALSLGQEAAGVVAESWLEQLAARTTADLPAHRKSTTPGLTFELLPGSHHSFAGTQPWGDDPRVVTINALGFRDPERATERAPGVVRIGCLGGSNTYGAAVSDAGTWPRALEAELGRRGLEGVEVWNLGVSAYDTLEKVALARAAQPRFRFDVLIWQLHNMGPRFVMPQTNASEAAARDPSLIDDWVRQPGNATAVDSRRSLLEDTPIGRLLAMAVERQARDEERTGRPAGDQLLFHWERGLEALGTYAHETRDGPAHLVFVPPPGLQLESDEAREALGQLGLPLLDLTERRWADDRPRGDIHPGREGYQAYADPLADRVLELLGLLPATANE